MNTRNQLLLWYHKKSINRKQFTQMSYYSEAHYQLGVILTWTYFENPYKFNKNTMEGILTFYDNNSRLTQLQMDAVKNVYEKFKVDQWFKENNWKLDVKKRFKSVTGSLI